MKIGYCVEGSTDRAFIKGLRQRWCPQADLIEGRFRASTGRGIRREIPLICTELSAKGCDIFIFLTDSNVLTFRKVLDQQRRLVPQEWVHKTVSGVAERNIECWLTADVEWFANRVGKPASAFRVADPKSAVEEALGITTFEKREEEIEQLVVAAPMKRWLESASFKAFYDDAVELSKHLGCTLPNERESLPAPRSRRRR